MTDPSTLPSGARTAEECLRFIVRASRELALLPRDKLARKARDLFLEASAFHDFSLWVIDPRTEVLYPWTLGNTPVLGRRPRIQVGQGLAGQAVAEEEARYLPSLPAPLYLAEEWGGRSLDSLGGVLTLPLRREGEPLGIVVLHRTDAAPSPTDIAFMVDLGEQLAIATGNARMYSEAMREKVENQLLLELGTKISGSLDSHQLLEQILDLVFQVVRYDAAGIYLVDKRNQYLKQQAIRGYEHDRSAAVRMKVGKGLIGWVVHAGRGIIVPDVRADPRYVNARDETNSEMVAPIRVGSEVIGAFNLESDELDAYESEDMDLLMAFAGQAAVAIERTELHEEVLEKRRLEEAVTIGQRIQRSFLPDGDPHVANFDIAGANFTSELVGGDYYDFIRIADNQLGVVIGDVSGKGLAAALIMASFRASLIAEIRNNYAIRTIVAKVNRLLWESVEPDRFVTAVYGVLDLEGRRLTYVNAGHNPPFLCRAGSDAFETLDATGPLLGTFDGATYKERSVELRQGDVLVLFTDGVTEAMSEAEEFFGEERLQESILRLRQEPAAAIVRGIRDEVSGFRRGGLDDDMTIVVVKGA